MFHCPNCGRGGDFFNLKVAGTEPSYTFRVKCPECGSIKVTVLPGFHEEDLKIVALAAEPVIENRHCEKHGMAYHVLMPNGSWVCLECTIGILAKSSRTTNLVRIEQRQCAKHDREPHVLMADRTWLCLRCRLEAD